MDSSHPVYTPPNELNFPNLKKKKQPRPSNKYGVLVFLRKEGGSFSIIRVYLSKWKNAKKAESTGYIGTTKIEYTHTSLQRVKSLEIAEAIAATYLISGHLEPSNKTLPLKSNYLSLSAAKKRYEITKWELNKLAKEIPESLVHYRYMDNNLQRSFDRYYYRIDICDNFFIGEARG